MKLKKSALKLIALALSLMLIAAILPMSVFAEGEFVSENLLQTKIDMDNSSGVIFNHSAFSVTPTTDRNIGNGGVLANAVDGNLENASDIWAYDTSSVSWLGLRYALTESSFVSKFAMYADFSNLPGYYDVYVSEDLDTLHYGGNLIGSIKCDGTVKEINVNKKIKYVMVIFNAVATDDTTSRIKEIQLWSGNEETDFTTTNLIKSDLLDSAKAVSVNGESATDLTGRQNAVDEIIAKDLSTSHTDLYLVNDGDILGIQMNLTKPLMLDRIVIDAGFSTAVEKYSVYASATLGNLYSNENKVASDVECSYRGAVVSINKYAQYVAVVCTQLSGNIRMRNLVLYDAYYDETGDEPFVTENTLITQLESKKAIKYFPETGNVTDSDIFNNDGALDISVDGDTTNHKDVSEPYQDPTQCFGAQYTLNDSYLIHEAVIYSGFSDLPDTVSVFASDSLENLYAVGNKVASSLVCDGSAQRIQLDKNVKYFAVVYETYGRAKEFELWTGDPNEIFVSKNVLLNGANVSSSRPMIQWVSSGVVDTAAVIDETKMTALTDGNAITHSDYNGTLDWDPARYLGAEYTLDDVYYIGEIKLFASIGTAYPESYDIYASDSLQTLYDAGSLVADDVVTTGEAIVVNLKKNIRYIAFFNKSYTGNPRIKEIEAWTADPTDAPEPPVSDLSVLTIGNSFSENTSIYASEIAFANGKNLTFGYLKSPSCSIEKHYNAAVNDIPGFKFQVTSPDGNGGVNRVTVKAGDSVGVTVDNPNAENGATIAEALAYTDWDVIVFQQESSSARNYDTFADLANLVNYVKEKCPNAKLMFHEVWRWGEWEASDFADIKANSERVARENGLEIIASGLAFEYARELTEDVTYPNDDDGNYQHANTIGQYLAGVCYVDALFGIECDGTKYNAHPYINADENVVALTECANKAVRYYNSYGDANFDGTINAEDLILIEKVILGVEPIDADLTLSDANNSGVVDLLDLVVVKKYLASVAADAAE